MGEGETEGKPGRKECGVYGRPGSRRNWEKSVTFCNRKSAKRQEPTNIGRELASKGTGYRTFTTPCPLLKRLYGNHYPESCTGDRLDSCVDYMTVY